MFTVYFKTSLFTIYLVAFLFWRPWQRQCCPKWCKRKRQPVIQHQQQESESRGSGFNESEQVRMAREDVGCCHCSCNPPGKNELSRPDREKDEEEQIRDQKQCNPKDIADASSPVEGTPEHCCTCLVVRSYSYVIARQHASA